MKIGIVTFHWADNYGAVLQAYALQQRLMAHGCECEIVDYRKQEKNIPMKQKKGISVLKRQAGAILNAPIRLMRHRVFEKFREESLILSGAFTEENIVQSNALYDGFLFGSDQIWNHALTGCDINYLGAFVKEGYKRNAYAASFGETVTPPELEEQYGCELAKFGGLAVRENEGKDRVLALTGRTAEVVLDPVFLLSTEEWKYIAKGKELKCPYIFLYHLQGKNTQLMQYAQYLSEKTGYRIIEFQAWVKIRKGNVKPVFDGAPEEFLNLIQNAAYVVTDSFHCTAFSVIFEKAFWSRLNPQKKKNQTRVGNLLTEMGLEDRILPDDLLLWRYNILPNYAVAHRWLNERRRESNCYLETVVENIIHKETLGAN